MIEFASRIECMPDRYTIHKGKKCELRCERIRGTRDYRCREYRC
jgi:hypothetical protein